MKCTVNECCHSLIGMAIKEYAMKRGDTNLDYIMLATTFALKNFPERIEDLELGNEWVMQYVKLPVTSDFAFNLKQNKQTSKELIGSSKLIGTKNFIRLILMLPFNLAKQSINELTKKITMTYTNMPCPSAGYDFGGYKCKSFTGFLPAIGDMLCGLSVVTHGQVLKLGLATDRAYIHDPD